MSTASFVLRPQNPAIKLNHILPSTKELHPLKSLTSNVSNLALFGGDIFNVNHVERELECQICLSVLEDPILLGCNAHSVCSNCLSSLYNHQKKERGGGKLIYCPSCGKESGGLKVKNLNEIKVNRELVRVKTAYEKERAIWVNEKIELETKLTDISDMAKVREAEKKKFEKLEKRDLDSNDAECLRDILQSFEMNQLKEVKEMILKAIETREKAREQPKKRGRPPKNSVEKNDEDAEEDQNDVKTPKKRGRKPSAQKSENTTPARTKQTLINLPKNSPGTLLLKRTNTVALDKGKKENTAPKTLKKLKTAQL